MLPINLSLGANLLEHLAFPFSHSETVLCPISNNNLCEVPKCYMQHLRVEENPILKMPHLEAALVLLIGPTLKKFNDCGIFHVL